MRAMLKLGRLFSWRVRLVIFLVYCIEKATLLMLDNLDSIGHKDGLLLECVETLDC